MISISGAAISIDTVEDKVRKEFAAWIASGMNAGMDYLNNREDLRKNPVGLLPEARSMIVLAIPFPLAFEISSSGADSVGSVSSGAVASGYIASYALGKDYHDVIRKLFRRSLKQLVAEGRGKWRLCVDSAPVMERYWGVASCLCQPTLSGMLFTPGFGTSFFLTELLTTLPLAELGLAEKALLTSSDFARLFGIEAEVPSHSTEEYKTPACTQCGRCLRACPTGALHPFDRNSASDKRSMENYSHVDARRCLSYLTIEHRGEFTSPESLEAVSTKAGKKTLFGCDRCLTSCLLNQPPFRNKEKLFFLPDLLPRPEICSLTPEDVLNLTPETFAELFRNSPIKRAGLEGLIRNAENSRNTSERYGR